MLCLYYEYQTHLHAYTAQKTNKGWVLPYGARLVHITALNFNPTKDLQHSLLFYSFLI